MASTRVVVAGTFDGLHPGHESFLQQAKQLGDELVVIVARDATVRRRKHRVPVRSESQRLAAVQALPLVDQALLGSRGRDYLALVVKLRPSILALGYDQWPDERELRRELDERGLGRTQLVRLQPFEPERYHSSFIRGQKAENRRRIESGKQWSDF